jgi:hypothetical protein
MMCPRRSDAADDANKIRRGGHERRAVKSGRTKLDRKRPCFVVTTSTPTRYITLQLAQWQIVAWKKIHRIVPNCIVIEFFNLLSYLAPCNFLEKSQQKPASREYKATKSS